MSEQNIKQLFTPFSCGPLELSNRIVMAPMSRYACPKNAPHKSVADYYRRRVEGGVGLIISEGTYINHPSASSYENVPYFYGEQALNGWKQVLRGVRQAGGKMMPQLWHVGSFRETGMPPQPEQPGFSPSGVLLEGASTTIAPQAMSHKDIEDVIDAYAHSAAQAYKIGFDGVEIHAAHGYLIDEFFWDRTNCRTDSYGGDIGKRSRLAAEVVRAVRQATAADFPISIRISQWKQQDYEARIAHSPQEVEQLITPIIDAGIDIFHGSTRRYWEPEFEGSELNWAGWLKKISGKPTISVGSVGLSSTSFRKADVAPLNQLITRLEREEFDLVAVGRALLADPQWANKVRDNRQDEIIAYTGKAIENYY